MRSWIEINQKAFEHNVGILKKLLAPHVALGIVLKGNAYGHGLKEMASLAEKHPDIMWLLVATIEEALLLRTWGCTKEILVLSYLDKTLLVDAIRANIVMSVTNKGVAEDVAHIAQQLSMSPRVHIKMDRGMNRLGIFPHDMPDVIARLSSANIEGIFAHVGITNHPDVHFIESVVDSFYSVCRQFDPGKKWMWHIGASGLVWSNQLRDMVRMGTILYGSWKSELHRARVMARSNDGVIPIITWKTTIMQIKHISAGDTVGYDEVFRATRPMRIAILPVGYADGYPRTLSQKGTVWVQGNYAPVLGLVNMNLMAIDISDMPHVREGAEVVLMGPQEHSTPYALAQVAATNPNDITSGLRAELPRICV